MTRTLVLTVTALAVIASAGCDTRPRRLFGTTVPAPIAVLGIELPR